jgi:hypothetical protein
MSDFGRWIPLSEELPPIAKLVAVYVVVGYNARGSGIVRPMIARRMPEGWHYPHGNPPEPPIKWTPLPPVD